MVCLLTQKGKGGYHVEIEIPIETDGSGDAFKEEKGTYPNIKNYIYEKYGVEVHTSYIAQVKRMCGMDMRDCYNKSKKDEPEIKICPPDKVEYIKDALRHFKMI